MYRHAVYISLGIEPLLYCFRIPVPQSAAALGGAAGNTGRERSGWEGGGRYTSAGADSRL